MVYLVFTIIKMKITHVYHYTNREIRLNYSKLNIGLYLIRDGKL